VEGFVARVSELRQRLEQLSQSGDSVERVDALNTLSEVLLFAGEHGEVRELADEAIAMARRLGYARGEAFGLLYQGAMNFFQTRLELALATLLEADANFRELGDEHGRRQVHLFISGVYRSFGDLDQAFLEGLDPVEFFAANADPVWESRARLNHSMTIHELGDFEGARKQCERILELREGSDEQWMVGRALCGIGAAHEALGNHREALGYQLRALKTFESSGYRMGEARALHEIGHSYERLGDRKKATEFYSKSLRMREEIDQREAQCTTLIALGKLCLDEDSEKAIAFLHRALELADRAGAKARVYQAHLALSHVHEIRGETTQALQHYKAYHDVQSEVAKFTSGMRVKNLQTLFEAERKKREAEIARLKESLEGGTSLGSYRLIELLGAGGMGEVWRGEHRLLARPAAIKVIRAQAADSVGHEQLVQRFRREAEVTSSLRSPHTVQLFDFGASDGGQFHYVMELLDGMDMREMVERFGPLPPERLVFLLRQACRSLAEAHEHGLIHRDIKPANLFVSRLGGEYDFLKVLDFGMVKTGPEQEEVHLTAAGSLVGTPAFVAPELVTGEGPTDGRVDLYSLACTAFWMLTGMTVFQAKTPTAMLLAHVNSEPPPLSQLCEHCIPDALEKILRQCLEKHPEARPTSALEVWDRLGEIDCGSVWDGRRAREWWLRHAPETASPGRAARGGIESPQSVDSISARAQRRGTSSRENRPEPHGEDRTMPGRRPSSPAP
jgi:serine/threonine protein kinase